MTDKERERIKFEEEAYQKEVAESQKGNAMLADPETLLSQNKNEIPILISKWIVKGYQSFLVTGDQGSGKTTYFKSIARFYPPSAALRINEINPEMNLRFAYPYRNILEFAETKKMDTQKGLDFQKKTSGTVNIIGEIATAQAAAWYVQTTKVASKAGAGTHHAKTVPDLISAFAMNMGGDEKVAEVMVADAIDYDIHMAREKTRFVDRISEIWAIHAEPYPYNLEKDFKVTGMSTDERNAYQHHVAVNTQEYQKRVTDRTTFGYRNLCHYDRDKRQYVLDLSEDGRVFGKDFEERILANCLTQEDKDEYFRDIETIKRIRSEEC